MRSIRSRSARQIRLLASAATIAGIPLTKIYLAREAPEPDLARKMPSFDIDQCGLAGEILHLALPAAFVSYERNQSRQGSPYLY